MRPKKKKLYGILLFGGGGNRAKLYWRRRIPSFPVGPISLLLHFRKCSNMGKKQKGRIIDLPLQDINFHVRKLGSPNPEERRTRQNLFTRQKIHEHFYKSQCNPIGL